MAQGRFARGKVSTEDPQDGARRAREVIEQEQAPQNEVTPEAPVEPSEELAENLFLDNPFEVSVDASEDGQTADSVPDFTHDLKFKPGEHNAGKVLPLDGLYGNKSASDTSQEAISESLEEQPLEGPNKGLEGTFGVFSPFDGLEDPSGGTIPPENPLESLSEPLEGTPGPVMEAPEPAVEAPEPAAEADPEPSSESKRQKRKRLKAEAQQAKKDNKKSKRDSKKKEPAQEPQTPQVEKTSSSLPSYIVETATDQEAEQGASGNLFLDSMTEAEGVEDIVPSFAPPTKNTAKENVVEGGRTIGRTLINLVFGLCIGAVAVGYFMITMGPYTLTQFGLIKKDIPVAVNAIPEGYEVVASRWGTIPAEGTAALADPFTLDATKVRIDEKVTLDDGSIGYSVTCLDGSCPRGLTNTISFKAVIGNH